MRTQVNLRLDEELLTKLDMAAARLGCSRNALMLAYLRSGLRSDEVAEQAQVTEEEDLHRRIDKMHVHADTIVEAQEEAAEEDYQRGVAKLANEIAAKRHLHRYDTFVRDGAPVKGVKTGVFSCSCGDTTVKPLKDGWRDTLAQSAGG